MFKENLMIFLTVLVPLKLTYTSLLTTKDTKLYGMYWAIYSLICFFCTIYPIHLK